MLNFSYEYKQQTKIVLVAPMNLSLTETTDILVLHDSCCKYLKMFLTLLATLKLLVIK